MVTDRSHHPDELTLELYVLKSEKVRLHRARIRRHLERCAWCSDLHRRIEVYYTEVETLQARRSENHSPLLLTGKKSHWPASARHDAPPSTIERKPSQRFLDSFRQYPFRWSSGIVALIAAMIFLMPRLWTSDGNPAHARPEKEFMVVYNKNGEELWRRYIFKGFREESMPGWVAEHPEQGLIIRDIDGDGKNEVIGIFGWAYSPYMGPDNPWQNIAVCFDADGRERWRYELHRNVTIAGVPYSDDYAFYQIVFVDGEKGKGEILALASHRPWFPNVIIRLDATTGAFRSEYWHNGMLPYYARKDLDGDGAEELLLGGQNNRLGQACLVAFDPKEVAGHAPAPEGLSPEGIPRGTEMYYVLFPGSDLRKYWIDITNDVGGVKVMEDGLIQVIVAEKIPFPVDGATTLANHVGTLYFYFNSSMQCVRVRASDSFAGLHARYRSAGLVSSDLNDDYLEHLRRGVRYWNGVAFVEKVGMNRNYREAVMKRNGGD